MRATIILGVFCWLMTGAVARGAEAAIPDAAAQEKALKLVAEIYEKPWKEARTSAEKTALAEKMIDAARKAQGDAAGRFVLLRVARDISVEAGDAATALRAIDLLDADFQIDGPEMKIAAVVDAAKSAVTEDHHRAIANETFALVEAAVDKDQYDTAERLVRVAQSSARKLREGETVRAYTDLSREVERIARAYKRIAPQREVLDAKPTDPEANLAVGKFLCFDKGDWRRGIPMMVLGSDKDLAALAERELRGPETAEEQVAIADQWWDRAEKADERVKRLMQLHAATWYEKALPTIGAGLVRTKVETRIKQTDRAAAPVVVDLLEGVDVTKHQPVGEWARQGDTLRLLRLVKKGTVPTIALPSPPVQDYRMRVQFARLSGKFRIAVIVPVGNAQCAVCFGFAGNRFCGLDQVDNKRVDQNQTAVRGGLINGQRYVADIVVTTSGENARVSVALNGQAIINWSGAPSSLSLPAELAAEKAPALAAASPAVFFLAKLETLSADDLKGRQPQKD